MADRSDEDLDFVNTLGREFCVSLEGLVPFEYLSSQDCFSAVSSFFATSVTRQSLQELTDKQLPGLVAAINTYFECRNITDSHVRRAIERILWNWPASTQDEGA